MYMATWTQSFFKVLGDYMNFVKRRCEDDVLSANRLIRIGMNVGGFSPAACIILYKTEN